MPINPIWPANGTRPYGDVLRSGLDELVADLNTKATIPGIRTAYYPLTAPNTTLANVLNHTQRSMVQFPVKPSRVRIGVANVNLRSPANPPASVDIVGMAYGSPVYVDEGDSRWRGDCTGPMTDIPGSSFTVPTDGTRGWSDWFTPGFDVAEDVVLSIGMIRPAASGAYASGNSYQAIWISGSDNYNAQTVTGRRIANLRLDIIIEYEYTAPRQVGLFIGDSNTVTYSPGTMPGVSGSYASAQPAEAWPHLAGMLGGFVPVSLAVGSAMPEDFASTDPGTIGERLWNRYDLPSLGTVDFAVVSLGGNGISDGLDNFRIQTRAIINILRGMGIERIYLTTVTPRGKPDGSFTSTGGTVVGGTLAAPCAAGATEITSTRDLPIGDGILLIGDGPELEEVTMTTVSGTGPFTVTLASPTANAHLEGEPLSRDIERYRKYMNVWTRNIPYGIAGVIDFDKLLSHAPGHYMPDQRYISTDYVHFLRSSSAIKAQAIVAAGVAVRFEDS